MSTRLENLRTMLARIEREIEREEAYQRRMAGVERDYRKLTSREGWSYRIVDAAARHFEVPMDQVLSTDRRAATVNARHVAAWLLRDAGRSFPEIGKVLERDHTTIIPGVRKVDASPQLMEHARAVMRVLNGEEREAS